MNDGVAAVIGYDVAAGERLGTGDRIIAGVGTVVPFVSGSQIRTGIDATRGIANRIFRAGKTNPGNLRPRAGEDGLSFRAHLSNPVGSGARPVLRPGDDYIEVDPSRLPPGSVDYDNQPDGHVTVRATPEEVKEAVTNRGRLPE